MESTSPTPKAGQGFRKSQIAKGAGGIPTPGAEKSAAGDQAEDEAHEEGDSDGVQWFRADVFFALALEVFHAVRCLIEGDPRLAPEIADGDGGCLAEIFGCGTEMLLASLEDILGMLLDGFGDCLGGGGCRIEGGFGVGRAAFKFLLGFLADW